MRENSLFRGSKHRTSWIETSVLSMPNIGTLPQRSPMFPVFRPKKSLKSPFPRFCNISDHSWYWWLPMPFSGRYRRGTGVENHPKKDAGKNCTLIRFRRFFSANHGGFPVSFGLCFRYNESEFGERVAMDVPLREQEAHESCLRFSIE